MPIETVYFGKVKFSMGVCHRRQPHFYNKATSVTWITAETQTLLPRDGLR
jgi:hypothetical protein